MNAKHTPGPWRIESYTDEDDSSRLAVRGSFGWICDICSSRETDANADFIVRACNAHGALVEALESFLRAPSVGSDGPGSSTIAVQDFNLAAARAAILKAKGEK